MTLNEWIKKSITRPHAVIATSLLAVWLVFAVRSYFNIESKHHTYVNQTASLLSIPVQQQNRIMAESLLETLIAQGGAISAEICKDGIQQVGANQNFDGCKNSNKFYERTIERNVTGSSTLVLRATFNILSGLASILSTLGLALLFVFSAFFFVQLVQKRIQDDLLNPLKNNFLGTTPLKIKELNILRDLFQEAKEIEAKQAVTLAIQEHNLQVAHDIRSPMQSINVLFKFMNIKDPRLKAAFTKAIDRANSVANSLLKQEQYAFVEEKLDCLDLLQIAENISTEKSPLFINGEIKVVGSKLVVQSKLSVDYVGRILSNLIDNAIQACDKNRRIKITINYTASFAEIIVSDSGQGMPNNVLSRLGEKGFSQRKNGQSEGNGLGVYAAKKAIEDIGGSIKYESAIGIGTTVTLQIPISKSLKNHKADFIFIDNDDLNHMTWSIWAEANGIAISSFLSVEEFLSQSHFFKKTIPIFLDYNLDNKKIAPNFLPALNALGFINIIIATADKSLESSSIEGAIAVIGKCPNQILPFIPRLKSVDSQII